MDPSKLLHASNGGKVEWNTTHCILPVAYRRICNGNPGLSLAVFFKARDKCVCMYVCMYVCLTGFLRTYLEISAKFV